MIATLLQHAVDSICGLGVKAERASGRAVVSGDGRHRGLDLAQLEPRVLLSATPLAPVVEGDIDPSLEGADTLGDSPVDDLFLFHEDYSERANNHVSRSGAWDVRDGRLHSGGNGDLVTTLQLDAPLPEDLEFTTTVNINAGSSTHFSNGLIIFDYQSPTDFKFAGAYAGLDEWVMGRRLSTGWVEDVRVDGRIDAMTDYDLQLTITGGTTATLNANGVPQLTFTYGNSLVDGDLGLGTSNALARYDDTSVRGLPVDEGAEPGTLPLEDNFDSGEAVHFEPKLGSWLLVDGQYTVSPELERAGVSTLTVDAPYSDNIQVEVTFSTEQPAEGRFRNGLVIFDYQSPDDFKYAGAFVSLDQWVIGEKVGGTWNDLTLVDAPIDHDAAQHVQLLIENGTEVTLTAADGTQVTHTFADAVTDGQIGLGSKNALTHFDDFAIVDLTPQPAQAPLEFSYTATLEGEHVKITGEQGGTVEITMLSDDVLSVSQHGRVLATFEDFRGHVVLDLGDADDHVVVDLGGHKLAGHLKLDLGDGNNSLQVHGGAIAGHLKVRTGDGEDSVVLSDDLTVHRHAQIRTGAGSDQVQVDATVKRSMFVMTGQDADTIVWSGATGRTLFVSAADGDDHVEVANASAASKFSVFHLGAGDDTFSSTDPLCYTLILGDDSDGDAVDMPGHDSDRDAKDLWGRKEHGGRHPWPWLKGILGWNAHDHHRQYDHHDEHGDGDDEPGDRGHHDDRHHDDRAQAHKQQHREKHRGATAS